jgi:hypothetical protein
VRFVDKFSVCEMAAAHIVSEIYQFRARVGYYDATSQDKGEEGEGGSEYGNEATIARRRFVGRIQGLFGQVSLSFHLQKNNFSCFQLTTILLKIIGGFLIEPISFVKSACESNYKDDKTLHTTQPTKVK